MSLVSKTNNDNMSSESNSDVKVNSNYKEFLQSIFPSADPNFISTFVDENQANPEAIQNFIDKYLENPEYPTIDEVRKHEKLEKLKDTFLRNFNVEHFIELYEDPFNYFENYKRKRYFNKSAFSYLLHTFNAIEVDDIKEAYEQYHYNLTLTVNYLENSSLMLQRKRRHSSFELTDELVFHEVSFIQNRNLIRNYLDEIRKKEAQELEECKQKGTLKMCLCCFEDVVPTKVIICPEGHIACKTCIKQTIQSRMSMGIYSLDCISCSSVFNIKDVQRMLSKTTFQILQRQAQDSDIRRANIEGLVFCPFCDYCSIIPDDETIFKCLNPECLKETCRKCKLLNHLPEKCDDKQNEVKMARLLVEEKMTEAFIRHCPKCNTSLYKTYGCNHIICPICKTHMCYLCSKILNLKNGRYSASHIKEGPKCELHNYSNYTYESIYVREIALKAKQELRSQYPSIKLKINKLLPRISKRKYKKMKDYKKYKYIRNMAIKI